jgi:hypothetical protein
MAAESELPQLLCPRAALGEPTADADSGWWRGIAPAKLSDTTNGSPPEQGTSVRAAWDARELRVLFEAVDTRPWATLTERDAPLYEEEVVEIFFDPVGDLQSYFEIEVNPLNTELDLVLRRNRSGYVKDFRWHCAALRTEVRRTATGWNAEFSIPFSSVAAEAPRAGAKWRVNFFRIDRPEKGERELSAWSPTTRATFHVPERFGVLHFAGPAL